MSCDLKRILDSKGTLYNVVYVILFQFANIAKCVYFWIAVCLNFIAWVIICTCYSVPSTYFASCNNQCVIANCLCCGAASRTFEVQLVISKVT